MFTVIEDGERPSDEADHHRRPNQRAAGQGSTHASVATGRSKSWLVAEALKSYVETEKAFIKAVEEGIKAADEGRLVDHDAVVAEVERRYRSR